MALLSDPPLQSYILYSSILALKILVIAILTVQERYLKKVFVNDEDVKLARGQVKLDDPDVERLRRAHLNDLENIPIFWLLAALYLTISPETAWTILLFRIYTFSRIIHTIVYIKCIPQPARGLAYIVSDIIKWYMGVKVVLHYWDTL